MHNHAVRKGRTRGEDVKEGLDYRDASASNKRQTKTLKEGMEFSPQIPPQPNPVEYAPANLCENQLDYLFLICDERIQTIRLHR